MGDTFHGQIHGLSRWVDVCHLPVLPWPQALQDRWWCCYRTPIHSFPWPPAFLPSSALLSCFPFHLPNILGLSVQGKVFPEEGAYNAWQWGRVSAFSQPELPVCSQQCRAREAG